MVLDFAHHVIECDEWSCLSSASSETGRRACLFSRDLIFIMIFSQLPCEVTHHVPIKQKQKKKKKKTKTGAQAIATTCLRSRKESAKEPGLSIFHTLAPDSILRSIYN